MPDSLTWLAYIQKKEPLSSPPRVCVYLTSDLVAELKEAAEEFGVSVSSVVRNAVAQELRRLAGA